MWLIHLHSHTFQRGMAGLAETRAAAGAGPEGDSFWTWRQVMYRFLGALDPDDVEAIAAFAMMEMLERGFTSLAEFHYLHHAPDGTPYADPAELGARIAAAAAATGIGLTLLPVHYAYGGFGGIEATPGQCRFVNQVDEYLHLVDRSRAALADLDGAVLGIAPHSLRAVTPDTLQAVLQGGEGPIHIHIAEQTREVEDCLAWSGQRPVEWLLDHAAVNPRWCLIHATHMTQDETLALAITEASLGDGIFDGARFAEAGGRWGVGSDSNVEITAPGELRLFEYSQRYQLRARNVLGFEPGRSTGRTLYESALGGGRQATGQNVGALAVGSRADFITLRAEHPDLEAGAGDRWLDAYLFVAGAGAIDAVWVAGRRRVEAGRHHDREAITARYRARVRRLAQA
jgi:formimidoylglutamate deiminase